MVHAARAEGSHCVRSPFALIFPTVCFLSRKLEANIPSRMAWVLFCVELPGPSSLSRQRTVHAYRPGAISGSQRDAKGYPSETKEQQLMHASCL